MKNLLKSKSLKANKKVVEEYICKICNNKFILSENIKQCEKCSNYFHYKCWEKYEGCNQAGCSINTKTCHSCGKQIKINALRCKHCGEYVDKELKEKNKKDSVTEEILKPKSDFEDFFIGLFFGGLGYFWLVYTDRIMYGFALMVLGILGIITGLGPKFSNSLKIKLMKAIYCLAFALVILLHAARGTTGSGFLDKQIVQLGLALFFIWYAYDEFNGYQELKKIRSLWIGTKK